MECHCTKNLCVFVCGGGGLLLLILLVFLTAVRLYVMTSKKIGYRCLTQLAHDVRTTLYGR